MSNPKARAAFHAELADGKYYEIAAFDNVFGETFVIYTAEDPTEPFEDSPMRRAFGLPPGRTFFITGDEVDWHTGLAYENGRLVESCMLSADERAQIDALLGAGSPAEQGAAAATQVLAETGVEGLTTASNSTAYRSAYGAALWRGGAEAVGRGFALDTTAHLEFFTAFLTELHAIIKANP